MSTGHALPDTALRADRVELLDGAINRRFLQAGADVSRGGFLIFCLRRRSSRTNLLAVLEEGRGTCSSKHALLAQLAGDQQLPVALMLGIYLMNERNTPGIGGVLSRYGLCGDSRSAFYLVSSGARIDVTRVVDSRAEPVAALLHEEEMLLRRLALIRFTCTRNSYETGPMLDIFLAVGHFINLILPVIDRRTS